MSIDAMKQALAALEQYTNVVTSVNDPNSWVTVADGGKPARDAITALRAAIEQPEQEPVAWYDSKTGWTDFHAFKPVRQPSAPDAEWLPLYTTPPPRREWQGLTPSEITATELSLRQYHDGDRYDLSLSDFARAIEARLKEKNV